MAATAAAPPSASSPQQHGELRALDALELPEDLKAKVKEIESLSHPVLLNRQERGELTIDSFPPLALSLSPSLSTAEAGTIAVLHLGIP